MTAQVNAHESTCEQKKNDYDPINEHKRKVNK